MQKLISHQNGWIEGIRHVPSPNFNERPTEVSVDLLVIHNISMPPSQFGTGDVDALFTNQLDFDHHPFYNGLRGIKVSSHFLISRDGQITQYVSMLKRAWHAGVSSFKGREQCNDFSIGIELEGTDDMPFTEVQYQQLASLTLLIMECFPNITQARITGHSDVAPGRKTDPGPFFKWKHYFALLEDLRFEMINPERRNKK